MTPNIPIPTVPTPNEPFATISIADNKIYEKTKERFCQISVVLTQTKIKVGCTEITPEAACLIVDKWRHHFGMSEKRIVL